MSPEIRDLISNTATLLGFVGSAGGFVSWLYERKTKNRLVLQEKRRIWMDISKVRGLMSDLEKAGDDHSDPGKMQAVGKLSFMLRDLIRDACMAEKKLTIATIQRWRQIGKLGSAWQEQLALAVLTSEEIDGADADRLAELFVGRDELPDSHPAYAGLLNRTPAYATATPRTENARPQ